MSRWWRQVDIICATMVICVLINTLLTFPHGFLFVRAICVVLIVLNSYALMRLLARPRYDYDAIVANSRKRIEHLRSTIQGMPADRAVYEFVQSVDRLDRVVERLADARTLAEKEVYRRALEAIAREEAERLSRFIQEFYP